MWCPLVKRLLSAFFDRELGRSAKDRISSHLEQCPGCNREMGRIEEGSQLARRSGRIEIPAADPAMLSRIVACMKHCGDRKGFRKRLAFQLGATAALVLLVAIFGTPFLDVDRQSGLQNRAYALDLGFQPESPGQDLLDAFRRKYVGKFREFRFDGSPDPAWVPFPIEYPTQLPVGMKMSSVMMFHSGLGVSIGLVFSDGERNLCLLQQPADRPVFFSGVTTVKDAVCRYKATRCRIGQYDVVTWTSRNKRCVLLSNLNRAEIESTVASLKYLDYQ